MKTKKQLQEELEILEIQRDILEVKAEIIKLEDNRWESIPFIGGTYDINDKVILTNGTTTNDKWNFYQV